MSDPVPAKSREALYRNVAFSLSNQVSSSYRARRVLTTANEYLDVRPEASCGNHRNLVCVLRRVIAPPDHVQIRPDEEQIVLIEFARSFGCNVKHVERRAQFSKRSFQARSIVLCSAES